MKTGHAKYIAAALAAALLFGGPSPALAQEHRAEQTREITYWLMEPDTASFRISHDFTADRPGQRYVHNFVRAGSEVSDSTFWDLNTGEQLQTYFVTGADVNALGTYPTRYPDESEAIRAELTEPIPEGHTVRIRVIETYRDPARYHMDDDELVWDRSLGRAFNVVKLPPGWMLTGLNVPAAISLDEDGLVSLRFINPRNDSLGVVIRARKRPGS
jgi:hypothetical protein